MKIRINQTLVELSDGATVCDALSHAGIPIQGTAVAIADRIVPRSQWSDCILTDGIQLTVIRAVCGG